MTGRGTTWRDALLRAERQTNDLCTAAVLERWKWWRPGYSSGYAQGVRDAQAVVFDAVLEANATTPPAGSPTSDVSATAKEPRS